MSTQRQFDEAWAIAFNAYKPFLCRPEDGRNIVALISALRGFAWSMYSQGCTDTRLKQLASSYATAQLARRTRRHASPR